MRRHYPDDPAPDSAVARIRDAINDAFEVAIGEHVPEAAGVAILAVVTVTTDAGDELSLDTRTTVRVDLERLHRAGADLGGIGSRDVVASLLTVLGNDADEATR
jgi:hypothetical protein